MHSNNVDQDPHVVENTCWLCKNTLKHPVEEYHSNQTKEEQLLHSETFKKILKKEILYFCQNTTIRGIPRIVKTTNKATKTLWITFFIFLCGGLIISLTFLVLQFREYNVIHPPRVLQNKLSPFPSFTLCNHRPLSYNITSFLVKRKMRNPREFAIAANIFANKYYYERNETQLYTLLTPAFSLTGYLESLPIEYHKMLGHDQKDFIIECLITDRDGSKHKVDGCVKFGMWKDTPHAQFINCFSFNIDDKYSMTVSTVEFYIYLNEKTSNSKCIDCFSSNVKSQLSGALLVIHKSQSFPNINQEAINLQPGTLTEVRLKTFINVMKMYPYGRCEPNTPKTVQMGSETFSYTEHLCKERTIQQEINTKCNCNAIEYPVLNRSLPFCCSLPKFMYLKNCELSSSEEEIKECFMQLNNSIKVLQCKSSITVLYHNDIIDQCFLPCSYYSYESDRSISAWPTKSWQLTWLTSPLGRSLLMKPELKEYQTAVDYFLKGEEKKATNILNTLDVLEKKLIAVIINKPNKNLHKVEEKEVLSLTSFLSQCGGLISIWIGLTMMSIVEVMEIGMNLFTKLYTKVSNEKKLSQHMKKKEIFDNSCTDYLHYTSVTNL